MPFLRKKRGKEQSRLSEWAFFKIHQAQRKVPASGRLGRKRQRKTGDTCPAQLNKTEEPEQTDGKDHLGDNVELFLDW